MAALEVHRGGRDTENVVRVEGEAARLLRELADSLPRTDPLQEPADLLADALALRVGRREFHQRRGARNHPCEHYFASLPSDTAGGDAE